MTRNVRTLVCAAAALVTAHAGDIQGHVVITQGLTKKRVTLPAYQLRGAPVYSQPKSQATIDELSRVAIYLDGPNLAPTKPLSAELKQQNRQFEPDILIVTVDSTISFPNADPIFHNVFSLSKIKQFDLGYYPAGQTRTVQFDKPGVVQVYCHLHPNMSAAVLVAPSAWYARPGADGNFRLSGIPAGEYQLVGWHKSAGLVRKQVEVPESGSAEVRLIIPLVEKQEDR